MVDVTQLTENQRYGLLFEMGRENTQIEAQNANAAAFNANRPINQPEQAIRELFTLETYAAKLITDRADQLYMQLEQYKEQVALGLFRQANQTKKDQVIQILGVPDIVQG